MKNKHLLLTAIVSFIFLGCNKDDVIIGDTDNDIPDSPSSSLNYSVIEYTPAPGQFINDATTGFADVSSQEEACKLAEERLAKNLFVSLGSWGGYIIVKFNESIINNGEYDFAIGCNTFDSSNEPGIVWVMQDSNGNGKPDDTWYELKGSHFGKDGYERNYWVTYKRPEPGKNTPWSDSNGETGFINWLGNFHSQEYYYPNWVKEDSYTLYGSRLPLQAFQDPETGMWTNFPFDWGYVDNFGIDFIESKNWNQFRISDAVTEDNEPANIRSIDFIKVQTAINGSAGWLGENSTEVCGFYSL